MATENLKTTAVTAAEATPPRRTNAGKGGAGLLRHIDGYLTATTAMEATSTYEMVIVPSEAIVKEVWAMLDTAVTTFTADLGVYYANTRDVPTDLRGDVIDADLWGSAIVFAGIVIPTQYTHEAAAAAFAVADMQKELWDAAGLSADPKCNLAIVLTLTASSDGAAIPYVAVKYVLPGS